VRECAAGYRWHGALQVEEEAGAHSQPAGQTWCDCRSYTQMWCSCCVVLCDVLQVRRDAAHGVQAAGQALCRGCRSDIGAWPHGRRGRHLRSWRSQMVVSTAQHQLLHT
jgi:hypothetical protein